MNKLYIVIAISALVGGVFLGGCVRTSHKFGDAECINTVVKYRNSYDGQGRLVQVISTTRKQKMELFGFIRIYDNYYYYYQTKDMYLYDKSDKPEEITRFKRSAKGGDDWESADIPEEEYPRDSINIWPSRECRLIYNETKHFVVYDTLKYGNTLIRTGRIDGVPVHIIETDGLLISNEYKYWPEGRGERTEEATLGNKRTVLITKSGWDGFHRELYTDNKMVKEITRDGNQFVTVYYRYDKRGNLLEEDRYVIITSEGNEVLQYLGIPWVI